MKYKFLAVFALIIFTLGSCYYDNSEDLYGVWEAQNGVCNTSNVTYSGDVVSTLNTYCLTCHDTQSAASLGGSIDLSSYNNVKVYAEDGSFYGSIIHQAPYSPMPTAGQQIPPCDQDKIKAWIDAGMPNN